MSSSGDGTSKGAGRRPLGQPVREPVDAQFSFQMKRFAVPPASGSVIMHEFKGGGLASARNARTKERIQEVEEELARELEAGKAQGTRNEESAGPSGSSTSLSDTSTQSAPNSKPRLLLESVKPTFSSAFAATVPYPDPIAEHVPAAQQRLGRSFDTGLRPTSSLRHQHSANNLSAFKADMFRETDIPKGTARPFASSMSNVLKPADFTKSGTQVSTTTSSAVPSYTTSKRGHSSVPKSRFHATTDVLFSNLHRIDPLRLLETMQLRSLLGVGSMGTVYNALVMGQRVVCKIMEHEGGVMKRDRERLAHAQREADISQLLVHPNIVTTYFAYSGPLQLTQFNAAKVGTGPSRATKEVTVLVQELCAGGTLRSTIDKGTLCDDGEDELRLNFFKIVVQLGVQVAYALVHSHAAGVLHCDLKAENILLQPIPEEQRFPEELYLRVKVSDFGIATVLPSAEVDKGVVGGMHGTVSHMPPEALRHPHLISPKTDIWSLGVVLWEVWTGQVPYEGCTPQQVIASVCSGKLLEWPPKTPPLLIDIVQQCWELDPEKRPNAMMIAERLAKVCGVLIAVDTDHESTEASRNLSLMPSKALADLDEEALELALLEDNFEKVQEALNAQQNRGEDAELKGGEGADEGEEEEEAVDPLAGTPPTDDVALSMWQLLHVRDPSECTMTKVSPNRQLLTAPLPFLNLEKYIDTDDASAVEMLWRRSPPV